VTQHAAAGAAPLRIWSGGGYELAEGTRWLGDRGLFVSTARYGIPDPAPEAGAILSARVDASALRAASFGHPAL
jgi:hypothetical protein